MTNEHLSLALQHLDDELLAETQFLRTQKTGGLPMKKRFTILIAAALITTMCCATAFAAVNGGWFKDVTNIFGAVTGTEYHNATEEISVSAEASNGLLTVTATLELPNEFPYRECETLRLGEYIINSCPGNSSDAFPIANGQVQIIIPIGELTAGEYDLHIASFIGEKKAEQPLPIYGDWESVFIVE